MKTLLILIRWTVGLLFIFSGLIKANDPLGLSFKMQEFFEVWSWHSLHEYTLSMAFTMNVFEVLAGVAVIIGWRMKLFSWLLLLLILFFTFLTGYALFSGKITTCGCFGDCLPLTPAQSFGKDIFLLVLILVLFVNHNRVKSFFTPWVAFVALFFVMAFTCFGQLYTLKHLPIVDCLPYKKGNNLVEQMKVPAGAVSDSFSLVFTYQKNGKQVEFDQAHFPDDFDSSYVYINRHDQLVKKGNGLKPAIVDFSLKTQNGVDTTPEIFGQPHYYLLVMARNMNQTEKWKEGYTKVVELAGKKNIPVYLVTSDTASAQRLFGNSTILSCDVTVLKTAARATPTYFLMQHADIIEKMAFADVRKLLKKLDDL